MLSIFNCTQIHTIFENGIIPHLNLHNHSLIGLENIWRWIKHLFYHIWGGMNIRCQGFDPIPMSRSPVLLTSNQNQLDTHPNSAFRSRTRKSTLSSQKKLDCSFFFMFAPTGDHLRSPGAPLPHAKSCLGVFAQHAGRSSVSSARADLWRFQGAGKKQWLKPFLLHASQSKPCTPGEHQNSW